MNANIPQVVIDTTREWCFQFSAGEWQDRKEIVDFIRSEFNYAGDTPNQYAGKFIARGVANHDFETRLRQWRWIVYT